MLNILAQEMDGIGIPYDFPTWHGNAPKTYWIGEYIEAPVLSEDGRQEYTVILTGTSRESFTILEEQKRKIKSHFNPISGLRKKVESGVVAFFYENSLSVPTDDPDLYRIQINLIVKEWRNTY